jgi:hypothetical protein
VVSGGWGGVVSGGVVVSGGGTGGVVSGGVESVGGGPSDDASEAPLLHPSATERDNRLLKSHAALRAPERAGIIRGPTNPSAKRSEQSTRHRQGGAEVPHPST